MRACPVSSNYVYVRNQADVIYWRYEHQKFENRLPFELQCWSTTHFEGFVELSALPLYLKRFRGNMVYLKSCCKT